MIKKIRDALSQGKKPEAEETKPEEIFGGSAGKVWTALNGNGFMTVPELSAKTGISREDVCGGLGWLGREGKLFMIRKGKDVRFSLA